MVDHLVIQDIIEVPAAGSHKPELHYKDYFLSFSEDVAFCSETIKILITTYFISSSRLHSIQDVAKNVYATLEHHSQVAILDSISHERSTWTGFRDHDGSR
jgi:hypothetical protein